MDQHERAVVRDEVINRAEKVLSGVKQRWEEITRIDPITVTPLQPHDGTFPKSADEYFGDFYPYAAGAAVTDSKGRLLCVYSPHRGEWETPGGAGEPGENPADTARRETLEESGIECEITGPLCARLMEVDLGFPETLPIPVMTFTARPVGGTELAGSDIEDHDEITDLRWFGHDELPTHVREYDQKHAHLQSLAKRTESD